jgi:2-polyprenyl-3-methyl-5-hydroxy-6-metoxy-1,4-benzoquinol methylase
MQCRLCASTNLKLIAEELRRGPGRVFYCAGCDLGMLESKSNIDLSEYYADEYWKSHGPDLTRQTGYAEIFEAYVNYQQRRLDLLQPYLLPDVRLLEVGCATGHFLFNARSLVKEVVGVDYDAGAAAYAAGRCGCKTYGGALSQSGLSHNSFDVVCAFQTLEHVPEPTAFISELARYLKPNGTLVIEVPNLRDPLLVLYDVTSYHKFYFHADHLFYFSPISLRKVAAAAGLDGDIHFVQDYNFLNHMNWVHTGNPQPTCHDGLGLPVAPLAADLPQSARNAVERWFADVDQSYKRLLAELALTENITFIGRAKDGAI